ncbi:PQQ-dependent sugar dehydrogenase [Paraflavitalea pollutisoli]|uniref:PQQ-dependent sugar dehydrogenase n=1 Tax=Paraflavitalea pollutisoli TaxID=3034143 RepID=UPI0023ED3DF4|nr:PQQ-dependent sugar dehydrogenase [Paraflavitalea sp. H1-2-19X]
MKTIYKCLFVLWALLCVGGNQLSAQSFPAGFQATKVADGLNPTEMKFSPDGQYLFITDKNGKVFLVENDVLQTKPLLDISASIIVDGEKGLTHLAIDPDFATNQYVYLYFTLPSARNRINRYTFDAAADTLKDPFTLMSTQAMVGPIHTGGAMNFGADGMLYVATGESSHPDYAQNFNSQLGKVLRMHKDGQIPTDNPFYNVLADSLRYIYARGLRNPYAADVHPVSGRYFICDVGQNDWEEINEIKAGKNYGWSVVEGKIQPGTTPPDEYVDPLFVYNHSVGCAVVGGVFYAPNNPSFPVQYLDKFFYGDYCNQSIRIMDPETNQSLGIFGSNLKRPVAFAVNPTTGIFYYLDRGGLPQTGEEAVDGILWKVEYTGSLAPVIGAQPATTIGSVGGSASFTVVANGLGLTYEWFKGGVAIPNSDTSTLVLNNLVLVDSGAVITVKVVNSFGDVTSQGAILRVTQRQPPTPVISLPAPGSTYVANSTMVYSGSATDAVDGTVPSNKLTWKIDFHHDTHYHPGLDATAGNVATGNYFIPGNIEVSDTVWYRVYLTAENSLGLKSTIYREVYPQKVDLHIRAMTGGRLAAIPLNMDGTITTPNVDKPSVKGVARSVTAQATYLLNDTLFTFQGWGNGNTNPTLNIITPNADTTIVANYEKTAVFSGEGLTGEYRTNNDKFTGVPTVTRIDTAIDFDWPYPTPPAPGVSPTNFTVQWKGYIQPRTSGEYTFYLRNKQSQSRFIIDGDTLISRWPGGTVQPTEGNMMLVAGRKYPVQIDFWANYSGSPDIELEWYGPRVFRQIVPITSLYAVDAALPVIFTDFTVQPQDNKLQLIWKVDQEVNVKGYAVERMQVGTGVFETIAFINAAGRNQYSFTDATAKANTLYQYRIREDDLDGRPTYSAIRSGLLSGSVELDFTIVPNPVNSIRRVQLVFTQALGQAEIQLLSTDGRVLLTKRTGNRSQSFDLPLTGIPAGTYYIKVVHGRSHLVKKLLVQ